MAAIVVERAGASVLVRAGGARDPRLAFADKVAAEDHRKAVVVDQMGYAALHAHDSQVLTDLSGALSRGRGRRRDNVRLVASGSGRANPDGTPSLAARLARQLGVEVIAPDGELVILRGGELFSAGPGAGWVRFRRGRMTRCDGPRFPAPPWESELPEDFAAQATDRTSVVAIPAGLWVRTANTRPAPLFDSGFGVPPDDRLRIVVGAPGEKVPDVADVARIVESLPDSVRHNFVLTVYGPEPVGPVPFAQQLAAYLGVPVRASHGMPYYAEAGARGMVAINRAGYPTWRPFLHESMYLPHGAPTPCSGVAPASGLHNAGPGRFWLTEGWLVDLIPCGFLVRPATATPEAVATRLPVDPDNVNLIVTAVTRAADEVPARALAAIEKFARSLPEDARQRLRLVASHWVHPGSLVGLGGALRVPMHVLTPSGPQLDRSTPDKIGAPQKVAVPQEAAGPQEAVGSQEAAGPQEAAAATTGVDQLRPAKTDRPANHQEPSSPGLPAAAEPEAEWSTSALPQGPTAVGRPKAVVGSPDAAVPTRAKPSEGSSRDVRSPQPPSHRDPAPVAVDRRGRIRPVGTNWQRRRRPGFLTPEPGASQSRTPSESSRLPPTDDSPVPSVSLPSAQSVSGLALSSSTFAIPPVARSDHNAQQGSDLDAQQDSQAPVSAHAASGSSAGPGRIEPRRFKAPETSELRGFDDGPTLVLPIAPLVRSASTSAESPPPPPTTEAWAAPVAAQEPMPPGAPESAAAALTNSAAAAPTALSVPDEKNATPVTDLSTVLEASPVSDLSSAPDVQPEPELSSKPDPAFAPEPAETDAAAEPGDPDAASEPGEPDAASEPGEPDAAPEPAPAATPLLLADHVSTDEERRKFRASLGWRFDAATQMVTRMLAERPGMRAGGGTAEALTTELAAAQIFASSEQTEVVEAIRSGSGQIELSYLHCLASGLRRLPSLQGVVVRGGPSDAAAVDDYVVGAELLEPAPMVARADMEAVVPGAVEVLIWSITSRRLAGLVEGERRTDVVFLPGTVFQVVAVDRTAAKPQVLLAEVPPGWDFTSESGERRASRIRKKLEAAAAARDGVRDAEPDAEDEARFAALPGMPRTPLAVSSRSTS
ncbi:hypothetical protein ACWDKQ_24260 [Saccharopolyspora sp. NPDC000995]